MKSTIKKLALSVLIFIIVIQQMLPVSFAENNENANIVITKTVRESIESYNKLTEGKDSIFVSNSNPCISFNNKDYQIFEMVVPESGYYRFDIFYGCAKLSYKPKTAVSIFDGTDYVEVARAEIEATGAYSTFSTQTIGYYAFVKGTYKIKVSQPYADIYFSSISLVKMNDGIKVSQSIDSFDKATNAKEKTSMYGTTPYVSFNGGDYQIFEIAVEEQGLYKFDLKIGAKAAEYRAITSIFIHDGTDYIEQVKKLVDSTGTYSNFERKNYGYFELKQGLNKIKVSQSYADIWFSDITVEKTNNIEKIKKDASDYTKLTSTLNEDNTVKMSHSLWATYSFDVNVAGQYKIFATASNVASTNTLSVFVNDEEQCSKKLEKGYNGIYVENYLGNLNLESGVNEIKLKHTGTMYTTFSISSIYLVRVGDGVSSYISGTTLLTNNDAYDCTSNDDILKLGDYLNFDVNIEEAGLYKVSTDSDLSSGFFGISVNGKTIGILNDNQNKLLFFEANAENVKMKIQVLDGEVEFGSLYFEKLSITEEDLKTFKTDINNASNALETEKIFDFWKSTFIPDFADVTTGLLSLTPIYAEIYFKEYDNAAEIISDFYSIASREKSSPSIVLNKNGNNISRLESGTLSIKVNTTFLNNTTTIVGAIYEKNALYKITANTYTGMEETLMLPFGDVSLSDDKDYTLKIIYLNNFTDIKPADDFGKIYKEFYVSPTGSDDNDGSENSPFVTIQHAVDVAAEFTDDMDGNIIINLAEGDYFIAEKINFSTLHSGKNGYDLIIRGAGENKSVINGGKKIGNWSYHKDGIYKAKYEADKDVRNLYVNGFPAIRAKSEYAFRADEMYSENDVYTGITTNDKYFPTSFERPQDLELVWELVWEAQRTPVNDVTYTNGTAVIYLNPIILKRNSTTSTTGFGPDKQFYLENAIELLDSPGEFYYNPQEGYIYYYPTEGEDILTADVYVGLRQGLVSVEGNDINDKVSNITFENIAFKYGSWDYVTENGFLGRQADCVHNTETGSGYYMVPGQFEVNYANNISINNCEFSCLGSSAISYKNSVSNSEITSSVIKDVSGTGIAIGSFEHEDNLSLSCENIKIKNNIIRRAAIEYRACAGISFYYDTAVEICHNTILNLPYTAISGGWGWGAKETGRAGSNKVCHNKIENVMSTLSDGGGIYFLGTQRNTVVTDNYINKVNRRNATLYSDNGSSYIHFVNNLCTNTTRFATASPGGHTNYYVGNYTDTDFIYEEYEKSYGLDRDNFLVIKDNIIIDPNNLPQEALSIKENSGVEQNYSDKLDDTDIPSGKMSIINITPKRTYTNGEVYEAETLYKSIDSNVGVYSGYLGISYPQGATYDIDVDKAGKYLFSVYTATPNSNDPKVSVYVNGEKQATGAIETTGSWTLFTNNEIGEITLPEGKVTLRITCAKSSLHIDCFTLKYIE